VFYLNSEQTTALWENLRRPKNTEIPVFCKKKTSKLLTVRTSTLAKQIALRSSGKEKTPIKTVTWVPWMLPQRQRRQEEGRLFIELVQHRLQLGRRQ
jgi:hypothetical protein